MYAIRSYYAFFPRLLSLPRVAIPGVASTPTAPVGTGIVRVFETVAGITGWSEKRVITSYSIHYTKLYE